MLNNNSYWFCAILFRICLPALTIGLMLYRPTVTSLVYFVMGCYCPYFSVPTRKTMKKSTGTYMKLLIISCIFTSAFVISFYFALYFGNDITETIVNCHGIEVVLRTLGIVQFNDIRDVNMILTWVLPEVIMLFASTLLYLICSKLNKTGLKGFNRYLIDDRDTDIDLNQYRTIDTFATYGKYFLVFFLFFTACLRVSLIGIVYYLIFLGVITYWACNGQLNKGFIKLFTLLIPLFFCNLIMLTVYQFQYFQDHERFHPLTIRARLLGMRRIKTYEDCMDPRRFKVHYASISVYILPWILFTLYQLSVLVARHVLETKDGVWPLFFATCKYDNQKDFKWKSALKKLKIQIAAQQEDIELQENIIDKVRAIIEHVIRFAGNHSSLASNFALLIWAITFVGWNELVLLLIAVLVWILPSEKKAMLFLSPFIIVYLLIILLIGYVYGLDLTDVELPHKIGYVNLKSGIGTSGTSYWVDLSIKSLIAIIVFNATRNLWQQRRRQKHDRALENQRPSTSSAIGVPSWQALLRGRVQNALFRFFAMCWIWMVIIMMICMEFWRNSRLYRINNVALAFICISALQLLSFNGWKRFMKYFWWIVVVYSITTITSIYFYQIEETRQLLLFLFPESTYKGVGFKLYTNKQERIFTFAGPLFLQIAVVIQQHYFQEEFNRVTSVMSASDIRIQNAQRHLIGKLISFVHTCTYTVIALLEVHLPNIVLLVGWDMCVNDMCAIFGPVVLIFTISCIFRRKFAIKMIYTISTLVQIFTIMRLYYMLKNEKHAQWNYVAIYERNSKSFNKTLNTADWLGFHESTMGRHKADVSQLIYSLCFIFTATLHRIVVISMSNYRKTRGLPLAGELVLFPDIHRSNCYDSIKSTLKFLCNHGFYKLGCEITFIITTMVMRMRMDAMAIVLAIWLLATFSMNRQWLRRIWLPTIIFLSFIIPLQYMVTLGFWPSFFGTSTSEYWNVNDVRLRWQQFCYLMNMVHPPKKEKISQDFWLLLIMSRQWLVFKTEKRYKGRYFPGGDNQPVYQFIDDPNITNPIPDFTNLRLPIDIYNNFLFKNWFYFSLMFTFLAGSMRPSIYSFGYIVIGSKLLWEGWEMFFRPGYQIIQRWNTLISYTILVMLARNISQIFGCVLIYDKRFQFDCEIYKFLALGCVDFYGMTKGVPNTIEPRHCGVKKVALGLDWDCICFFFLIIQQRMFKSFYFIHIVNDLKVGKILSNRGTELIEELRQKKRDQLEKQEATIKANIELKLNQIRTNYPKIGEIRNGDYRHFTEVDKATDVPLLPPTEEEVEKYDAYGPMPLSEYFGLYASADMETVINISKMRNRRRATMIKKLTAKDSNTSSVTPVSLYSETHSYFLSTRHLRRILLFSFGAFESSIVSLIGFIDRHTIDFRYILAAIDRDKRALKEKTDYTKGLRVGSRKIWYPEKLYTAFLDAERAKPAKSIDPSLQYNIYTRLVLSLSYIFLAYAEWLCYLQIILYQILTSNFISLPLSLMMFCWGSLTVPRPTKTFWIIMIGYSLIMVLIKNLFAMGWAPWTDLQKEHTLFFPPSFIGLYAMNKYLNLLLLFSLFIHRIVLRKLGLWRPISYRATVLKPDGDYVLKNNALVPFNRAQSDPNVLTIENTEVSIGDYFPAYIFHGITKYAEGFRLYIQQLIYPSLTQIPVDVYLWMFLCDLVNLFLLLFAFGSFAGKPEATGLLNYIMDNKVPMTFIVVCLLYMIGMMIDRTLYLRRNRFGKLVYHFFQVTMYHGLFFIVLPLIINKTMNDAPILQAFYIFKSFYFLFSAYQIRNGYKTLISYHYLWHGHSQFHRICYKIYRFIPYFLEIRCLFDWICSDSCLGLPAWFKMEDVTQSLFDQKCVQEHNNRWYHRAGIKKSRLSKYLLGGSLYLLLVFTVVAPLLLFSLSHNLGVPTQPRKITMELYLGRSQAIYQSVVEGKHMEHFLEAEYHEFSSTFNTLRSHHGSVFETFQPEDLVVVKWSRHSQKTWDISEGSRQELIAQLQSHGNFMVRLELHYTHVGNSGAFLNKIHGQNSYVPALPSIDRQKLIDCIKYGNKSTIKIPLIFPKFLSINNAGNSKSVALMEKQLSKEIPASLIVPEEENDGDDDEPVPQSSTQMRNLVITLQGDRRIWWQVQEDCPPDDINNNYYLSKLKNWNCDQPVLYIFNEKVFTGPLTWITEGGIFGLYLIYFMLVIEFLRDFQVSIEELWIRELPNCDKIYRKCMEIYVARDMNNFELEREIFDELICIMRSRDMLIKITRYDDNNYDPTLFIPEH